MQDTYYTNVRAERHHQPIHVSKILANIVADIMSNVIAEEQHPPTIEESAKLYREQLEETT